MRKKDKIIKEISYKELEEKYEFASLPMSGFPLTGFPITATTDGYLIRIKAERKWTKKRLTHSYDYFHLDDDGLILQSPRGLGKFYNKRVRIIDIEDGIEKYKLK